MLFFSVLLCILKQPSSILKRSLNVYFLDTSQTNAFIHGFLSILRHSFLVKIQLNTLGLPSSASCNWFYVTPEIQSSPQSQSLLETLPTCNHCFFITPPQLSQLLHDFKMKTTSFIKPLLFQNIALLLFLLLLFLFIFKIKNPYFQ